MILVLEPGLPQNAIQCARSKIVLRMASDGYPSWFGGVFVLTMAAILGNLNPAVILDYTKNFTNSHDSPFLREVF